VSGAAGEGYEWHRQDLAIGVGAQGWLGKEGVLEAGVGFFEFL